MSSRHRLVAGLLLGILLLPAGQAPPLWARSLDSAPPSPQGPARIQSSLWGSADIGPAAKPAAHRGSGDVPGLVVILVPRPGQGSASIDTSSFAGLGVEVLARSRSLMRASVPASSLLAVSGAPGVSFVRRPYRPHAQETWSEGGVLIRAFENRFAGVRGQGAKVAVIDGGFKGADPKQLPEDMPGYSYLDFTEEGIYAGDSVHGTACAEIIYDVAPEAALTLLKVGDLVDLENAKDVCIREGIHIINHSLGWFGTGIGDGRGTACNIVNDAADNGILWVNSAGNDAKSHYDGFWSDFDSDGWQNFDGEDELLKFEAEEGDDIQIFLTWNDWPSSGDNYDLYVHLVNPSGDPEIVAESTDRQDVLAGAPVESILYEAGRSGEYGIAVRSEDARARRLKLWSLSHDFEEYAVAENSIGSPADARGAMSVGAIHFASYDLGIIADYSSRGPTTDGRFKPELVAPSGVSTASYGDSETFYGYNGTSAAAPHVAGAAALIKSAHPSYSVTDLWQALVAATVDIDAPGRDNDTGYGKLVLPLMNVASPRITSVTPGRARYGQVVTIQGTGFGSGRAASRVIFFGGTQPGASDYVSWGDTRIQVRVPTGARTGDLQVLTAAGSDTAPLTVTSPWVRSISPRSGRANTLVTVSGSNFGASRGSGSVRIGSSAVSTYSSWSSTAIRFRIPANTASGDLTVRTPEGTSNALSLEVTSPYLGRVSPARVKPGDRLTLTGAKFGRARGSGYVLFTSNVRPSSSDYQSWSDGRIVVHVPARAVSGDVKVVTAQGSSGTRRIEVAEAEEPRIASVSPTRARYNQTLTIRGNGFGGSRGAGRVVFYGGASPTSYQYLSWSDTRIQVRVPTGARTGDLRVVTGNGSAAIRLTVTSPWIRSLSPRSGRANTLVTVSGTNFGASRGSSSVRIGAASASSYISWSNTTVRFRIPVNARSGHLSVRTSEGTSNSTSLEVTSPYLSRVSPTRVSPGDRLTLTGSRFGGARGSGYVLFAPNVRPSSSDYQSWSDSRIVVEVPDRAESGDVKVVTARGSSGTRRVEVDGEALEPLPSTGVFGYAPPALTSHPKSVRFGLDGIGRDVVLTWTLRNDSEVGLLVNGRDYASVPASADWQDWWIILGQANLHAGRNVIEFRNKANQNRSSSYTHWQLKDVRPWRPFGARLAAGARRLSPSSPVAAPGLGHPFPAPFNAEVTVPFVTEASGPVRISVYNLAGQRIRLLRDAWTEAGSHRARWDGRTDSGAEAGSGVYCVLLQAPELTQSARLVLIR